MRHSDGLRTMRGGEPRRASHWRLFPWAVAAAMGLVVAVNGGMIYAALHSFPGSAGNDGFDLSNRYDQVIDRAAQQAALGWSVQADTDGRRHPVLLLRKNAGAPLTGADVQATAQRPLGPAHVTSVGFHEVAPGRYVGDAALDEAGQWDLLVSATRPGQTFSTTRRVVTR